MSKRENEAVVNRYLLSTLYFVIIEFLFYIMNRLSYTVYAHSCWYTLIFVGAIGVVAFAVAGLLKKVQVSTAVYYAVVFAVLLFSGLFVKYYYIMPSPYNELFIHTARRFLVSGAIAAVLYVYEIIRYFLNVNK